MQNLIDPPILFFLLGVFAVVLKSDLKLPKSLGEFLSIYLLMSLGFKGGLALSKTGFQSDFLSALLGAMIFATFIPWSLFYILKNKIGYPNAAAVGATYGSVSAVTFVTATTWLETRALEFDGSMIAILALMEAPAIIMAILLYESKKIASETHSSKDKSYENKSYEDKASNDIASNDIASKNITFNNKFSINKASNINFSNSKALQNAFMQKNNISHLLSLIHKSLLNGSVYLLLGSLLVGLITGYQGEKSIGVFLIDLFKGFLGIFLLDMGIKTAKQVYASKIPLWLIPLGIFISLSIAFFSLIWCYLTEMSQAQSFLFLALTTSGSYIAVPAALKKTIPEANPGIYLSLALGITFPFNILIGLPLYWQLIKVYFT